MLFFLAIPAPARAQAPSSPSASRARMLEEAGKHLAASQWEQAASRFREILKHSPSEAEALFGLGIACSQLGRNEEAEGSLKQYLKLHPDSADGHCILGLVYLASGKREEARVSLERGLRLDPGNVEAIKALAHVEAGNYRGERVVALLQPLVHSAELDEGTRLLLATGYAQAGRHRESAALLAPSLEKQPPPPPETFLLAARSSLKEGNGPAAARACSLGLQAHLNSDELERGCLEVARKGHLDSFVSQMESSLHDSVGDVPRFILLGRLMSDANPDGSAELRERGLQLLQKAAALDAHNPSALYNLGRCLRLLQRPEEASPLLERALTLASDPELRTLIATQLGLTERELRHAAKAEEAFRRALEESRKTGRVLPESAFTAYRFFVSAGNDQEAKILLEEILKGAPGFLPARLEWARELAHSNRPREAAAEAELVVRHTDPESRELSRAARLFLVRLYTQLGQTQKAASHLAWIESQKQ